MGPRGDVLGPIVGPHEIQFGPSHLLANKPNETIYNMEEVVPSIQLRPRPGFVVKTRILESSKPYKYGVNTKVFINVCYDAQVPAPATDFDPAVVFPLIIDNKWEIPLIVSNEKADKDKKGQPSYVYDCCINNKSFQWVQTNADLRSILIEWCLESIELLYEMTLEREYSIPKMLSKGDLSHTEIRQDELSQDGFQRKLLDLKANETLGLLEELRGENEKEEEEGELPDLMNIGGGKKPLIEEIGEMRITEGDGPKSGPKSEPAGGARPVAGPVQIEVALLYPRPGVVRVGAALDPALVSAQLDPRTHSLVLENRDPTRFFTAASPNKLHIPVQLAPGPVRSFYVGPEQALYFFL